MTITLGTKVTVGQDAVPYFARGLRGIVTKKKGDLCWVELNPFPANRKKNTRMFYESQLVVQPDRRLLDWLAGR